MEKSKSVVTVNDYGKVTVNIKEIMDDKGITRNYLAKATNTRFEVINKWYNGQVEKMDLDIHYNLPLCAGYNAFSIYPI